MSGAFQASPSMKFFARSILLLGCASSIGCATQVGGKNIPQPSAGFAAKDVLPNPPAQVYAAAKSVLDDDNVAITGESKEDGRINTDYVEGPSSIYAMGILGGNSSRYKYLIKVKPSGSGTKLTVAATLESAGSKYAQSWKDVSSDNPETVTKIQDALVEKIENKLK
jgi:uncharacterized lipoprotein